MIFVFVNLEIKHADTWYAALPNFAGNGPEALRKCHIVIGADNTWVVSDLRHLPETPISLRGIVVNLGCPSLWEDRKRSASQLTFLKEVIEWYVHDDDRKCARMLLPSTTGIDLVPFQHSVRVLLSPEIPGFKHKQMAAAAWVAITKRLGLRRNLTEFEHDFRVELCILKDILRHSSNPSSFQSQLDEILRGKAREDWCSELDTLLRRTVDDPEWQTWDVDRSRLQGAEVLIHKIKWVALSPSESGLGMREYDALYSGICHWLSGATSEKQ